MAKISIDVEEIKKGLKATALTAKAQLTEFAKKAQKDLSQKEVLKKFDQVVEIVKSKEFMKNPKVIELTKKVMALTEQFEKTVAKNASQIVHQVKAQVGSKLDRHSASSKTKEATSANSTKKAAPKKTK